MISKLSKVQKAIVVILPFIISMLLSLTLYSSLFVQENGVEDTIYITALNEKDKISYGTEARIVGISINGEPINIKNIELKEGWAIYDDSFIAAYGITEPSTIAITSANIKNIDIQFVKQIGSGYVKISVGDYEETINLYSQGDWDVYNWNHDFTSYSQINIFNNVSFFIVQYLIWLLLICLLICYKVDKDLLRDNKKIIYWFTFLVWIQSFYTDKLIFNSSGISVLGVPRILVIKLVYLLFISFGVNKIFNLFLKKHQEERKRFLKYFISYWCIMLVFVISTWPGVWRWDELEILYNMVNWDLTLWQHYLTSIYYMIGFMLLPLPGGFILFQVTLISIIVAHTIEFIGENIKNNKLCYIMFIPFLLLPSIDQNLYPIRMTLYTYIELLYLVIIAKLYKHKNVINHREIVIVSFLSAILCSWRTEGIFFILITPIIFWTLLKEKVTFRVKIMLTTLSVLCSAVLIYPQNYLANKYGSDNYKVSAYVEFLDDLIKVENVENPMGSELQKIDKVLSVEKFCSSESGEIAFWNGGVRNGFTDSEYKEFQKSVLNLIIKHMDTYILERIDLLGKTSGLHKNYSNTVWGVMDYYRESMDNFNSEQIRKYNFFKNEFEYNTPINMQLRKNIISILESRNLEDYNKTIWTYGINFNLFIPIFVVLLVWVNSIFKKKYLRITICTILLLQTGVVFLVAPAPYFMYYFPIYLGGYILLCYKLIKKIESRKEKEKSYE